MRARLLVAALILAGCPGRSHHAKNPVSSPVALADLREGQSTHGFTPVTVYLDDAGHRIGARLTHDRTGFTFDYLQIESAPQGFLWVNSFPTSDKGEPHTQEHLLLGKGNRGRTLGSTEAMQLATSSAFTAQLRTAYHFHTVAAHDVFWPVFRNHLDALLNPDYSDEEIRREVRNFGVDKADDGSLHLDEKGTVYNEMVRTYEEPGTIAWDQLTRMIYGERHPLALSSGGTPEALRTLTAEDIRTFHDANYHLANMGMIGAFPRAMELTDVLEHTSAILDELSGRKGKVTTDADLPAPAGAEAGAIQVVPFPSADETSPGPIMFAWPATRTLPDSERLLLALFLDAFAGDESTTLYKKFIDSKTRALEVGATAVWTFQSNDEGLPIYLGFSGVPADHLTAAFVEQVRGDIVAELQALAGRADGDAELAAFDARVASRVIDLRRRLAKFLDTPPQFGTRGIGSEWFDFLHVLEQTPGFEKSLTMRPALAEVEAVMAKGGNPWRERLRDWGLLDAPYGLAARPSADRMKALDAERAARNVAELKRLAGVYGTKDDAATLARYQQDYDAATQALEDAEKAVAMPPFVDTPPMTLDDDLHYTTDPIAGVPALTAQFDSMTSARVGLAFRVDAVAEADLFYLALLPSLMSDAGVYQDGAAISAEEMAERLRKEILDLSVYYTSDFRTGRAELVVEGAGNDLDETRLALGWMQRVMLAPDWRADNLPRLRDIVDQSLTAFGQVMQGPEESWVEEPRDIYWRQDSLPLLHTTSFLTQRFDLLRLRWMLIEGGVGADTKTLVALASDGKLGRDKLAARAKALVDGKSKVLQQAGKDLLAFLAEIPDRSLAVDWKLLCKTMVDGLQRGPTEALAGLARARAAVLARGNARAFVLGSTANEKAIAPDLEALIGRLDATPPVRPTYTKKRFVDERLGAQPVFVGLVNPNTQGGVFLNSAPGASYLDTDEDLLLDFLTINLYSGHGAHSLFMKTWAAGLAYSNGAHRMPREGRIEYYAERVPVLPQTLRFVIGEMAKAKPDPAITEYAIAGAYTSRVADSYEGRTRAMAEDLADGITPDKVRAFRAGIATLRERKDLTQQLFDRIPRVYGSIMPGFGGVTPNQVPDGVFFVIGPTTQLDAYQEYLTTAVGKDATLYRLYPRDYWMP